MSYNYWNNFIKDWCNLPANYYTNTGSFLISGWQNPNTIPLINKLGQPQFSLEYIPEPWWGNAGNSPLESVVINYNPGEAEIYKHFSHGSIKALYNFPFYSSFVDSEIRQAFKKFPRTHNWHLSTRAIKIFNTLNSLGVQLQGNNLLNHLSIELIPWHTADTRNILPYINSSLNQIYEHSIIFAADESQRISNIRLKNKVIVRSCYNTIIGLLKQIQQAGIDDYIPKNNTTLHTTSGNGSYFKFYFNKIPGVEFICIWGKKSRNGFPPLGDMNQIL